jgi:hypothetical protein
MSFAERVLEDISEDLEYHPRRGWLYLAVGGGAVAMWIYAVPGQRTDAVAMVCRLDGLGLVIKGLLLLRRSSAQVR